MRLVRAPTGSPCHHLCAPQGANGSGGIYCPSAPSDHPSASGAATTTALGTALIAARVVLDVGPREPIRLARGTWPIPHGRHLLPPLPPASSPRRGHRTLVCSALLSLKDSVQRHCTNPTRLALMLTTQLHRSFRRPALLASLPRRVVARVLARSLACGRAPVARTRPQVLPSCEPGRGSLPMRACPPPPSGPPRPRRLARGGQSRSR